MIVILVVGLLCFSEYAGGDPVSRFYGDYGGLVENLKNTDNYEVNQYDPKAYLENIKSNKEKKEEYIDQQGYEDKKEVPIEEPKYVSQTEEYNNDQNKQEYESKENEWDLKIFYGESKFEKYDGPKDYVVANKNDRYNIGRRYYGGKKSDSKEYDYVAKCDIKEKECLDGKDCYDKAKDRSAYDRCRDTYGSEDRYYEEQDRYTSDRYRLDDKYDNDYDRDCYDNSKDRAEYEKCQNYYKKCSDSKQSNYRYKYDENDWKNDKECFYAGNLVGLGRNDREDVLIRPCDLDDRQCIRKFFAQNSNCKPAYGPIPDPLYLKRSTVYIPFANLTMLMTRVRVTGLSSLKITEFYVNKDTKNLVIAFSFKNLNETTPRNYYRYKRPAKESIVLSDYTSHLFTSGTFTAVIPKIPHLRLDLAEVHVFINELAPRFFLGPGVASSTDPDVIASFARLVSNLSVAQQEFLLLQSQLFTAIYIQENICDFGLKLISV